MERTKALVLLVLARVVSACSDTPPIVAASFSTPLGLAVAHHVGDAATPATWSRLFVSNYGEDTVQVLELGGALADLDFVYSDSHYFPLRIPSGPGPGDLAATPDGRYVVVLNLVSEEIRLVDAGSLRMVTGPSGAVAAFPLAPLGARPNALVAAPGSCGDRCHGRFFVTLSGAGAVVAFEVRATDQGPSVTPTRVYDVGGEPTALTSPWVTQRGSQSFPQGYSQLAFPRAAYSHSASVGSREPKASQKATASS